MSTCPVPVPETRRKTREHRPAPLQNSAHQADGWEVLHKEVHHAAAGAESSVPGTGTTPGKSGVRIAARRTWHRLQGEYSSAGVSSSEPRTRWRWAMASSPRGRRRTVCLSSRRLRPGPQSTLSADAHPTAPSASAASRASSSAVTHGKIPGPATFSFSPHA